MNDENSLRQNARAAIDAGKLPAQVPYRTWAGKASTGAHRCTICSQLLSPNDVELELEFTGAQAADPVGNHYFHMRCFAAWESEREKAARHERDPSGARQYG
jgi:hypothetical protein